MIAGKGREIDVRPRDAWTDTIPVGRLPFVGKTPLAAGEKPDHGHRTKRNGPGFAPKPAAVARSSHPLLACPQPGRLLCQVPNWSISRMERPPRVPPASKGLDLPPELAPVSAVTVASGPRGALSYLFPEQGLTRHLV